MRRNNAGPGEDLQARRCALTPLFPSSTMGEPIGLEPPPVTDAFTGTPRATGRTGKQEPTAWQTPDPTD
jgi:hypothetical protein